MSFFIDADARKFSENVDVILEGRNITRRTVLIKSAIKSDIDITCSVDARYLMQFSYFKKFIANRRCKVKYIELFSKSNNENPENTNDGNEKPKKAVNKTKEALIEEDLQILANHPIAVPLDALILTAFVGFFKSGVIMIDLNMDIIDKLLRGACFFRIESVLFKCIKLKWPFMSVAGFNHKLAVSFAVENLLNFMISALYNWEQKNGDSDCLSSYSLSDLESNETLNVLENEPKKRKMGVEEILEESKRLKSCKINYKPSRNANLLFFNKNCHLYVYNFLLNKTKKLVKMAEKKELLEIVNPGIIFDATRKNIWAIGGKKKTGWLHMDQHTGLYVTHPTPTNKVKVIGISSSLNHDSKWTQCQILNSKKCDSEYILVDNKIFSFGGSLGNNTTNAIEYLDLTKGPNKDREWDNSPEHMDFIREQFGIALLGKEIYIVGGIGERCLEAAEGEEGYESEEDTDNNRETHALDTVESFNIDTLSIKPLASMKEKRIGVKCATLDGKIYAIGGSPDGKNAINTVEVYDPVSNTWSYCASMCEERQNGSAFVMDGWIFAVGGNCIEDEKGISNGESPSIETYDVTNDVWTLVNSKIPKEGYYSAVALVHYPIQFDK